MAVICRWDTWSVWKCKLQNIHRKTFTEHLFCYATKVLRQCGPAQKLINNCGTWMDVTGNAGVLYNRNLLWISGLLYNPNLLRIFKGILLTNAGSTYVLLPNCYRMYTGGNITQKRLLQTHRKLTVEPLPLEPSMRQVKTITVHPAVTEVGYLYNTDSTLMLHHPSTAGRVAMTLGKWCRCGCRSSDGLTNLECICCTEGQLLDSRLGADDIQCITQHQGVATLCLNPVVVLSMWPYIMSFKNLKGPIQRELTNR